MTGLVNSISTAFAPSTNVIWNDAPTTPAQGYSMGPGGMPWPSGPVDPLATMSQKLNLASMSLDLFGGLAEGAGKWLQSRQEASALGFQAKDQEMQAKQEMIKGQQASNDIMDNALQAIGAQRLAYAVNGMDINFGTPGNVETNTRNIADRQTGMAGRDAAMAALTRRKQAAALMTQRANVISSGNYAATAAVGKGFINAYASQQDLVQRELNRG